MKVCIDPGHGMSNRQKNVYDPGATHRENGVVHEEASIALKYGLALKDIFRAKQMEVFMTRDDATDPTPVTERARNAQNAGCDVFISLHLNDFEDDAANGLEVLFRDEEDKVVAQSLQSTLIEVTKLRDRGIKQRSDLAVLKFQGVAVLIELGFIANDKDRETLLNPQIREAVCKAIVTAATSKTVLLRKKRRKR
jgi:N-acetylmuramoyl-L-alanine amidase